MICLTKKKNDSKTIKEALKVLGKENFALIIHGSSFPACDGEDTGFGSFNSEAGHALIDYASNIFNAIQLGPAGKTKSSDSSPYCGTIFSGNPLFIDLKQLTTKEWGEILSLEAYKKVVRENPKQNIISNLPETIGFNQDNFLQIKFDEKPINYNGLIYCDNDVYEVTPRIFDNASSTNQSFFYYIFSHSL